MFVCMSVRNGFTIEIYGFMHSLCTFWHGRGQDAIARWRMALRRSRLRTRKIEDDARTSPDVWKTVNCSTKG